MTDQEILELAHEHGLPVKMRANDIYPWAYCEHLKAFARAILQAASAAPAAEPLVWMREGAKDVMHNFRFDRPKSGPWIALAPVSSAQPVAEPFTFDTFMDHCERTGLTTADILPGLKKRLAEIEGEHNRSSAQPAELQKLTEPQIKGGFEAWVKEDRIPPIARKHHYKTWCRAIAVSSAQPAGVPEVTSDMMNAGADAMREGMVMMNSGRSYQAVCKKIFEAMTDAAPSLPDDGAAK